MIQPITNNFNNRKTFTSGYDKETQSLLVSAENLFDKATFSSTCSDVFVSSESGDVDIVKKLGNKEVALTRLSKGNILLQVADKSNETVDVLYHNVSDNMADRFFRYSDTKLYPWNKGRDVKLASDLVVDMKPEGKSLVEAMCKKYIPEFLGLCKQIVPTQLLKNRI